MRSCDNCTRELTAADRPFPVGQERGTQRDPVTATLDLCAECADALGGRVLGPATPVDLDRFTERRLLALGHFTCREATRLAVELDQRGYTLRLTVGAPDGSAATTWTVTTAGRPVLDGVVLGVDLPEAIRQAYAAARGDGWPDERRAAAIVVLLATVGVDAVADDVEAVIAALAASTYLDPDEVAEAIRAGVVGEERLDTPYGVDLTAPEGDTEGERIAWRWAELLRQTGGADRVR